MKVMIGCTTCFGNVGVQFQVWVHPSPNILCSTYWDNLRITNRQFTNTHSTRLMTRPNNQEFSSSILVNNNGTRQLPCGTPKGKWMLSESPPSTNTRRECLERYDFGHTMVLPMMPNIDSSRFNKMSWSMVSNAALKSRSTSSATFRWLMLRQISFKTLTSAISVLWFFLLADSSRGYKAFSDLKKSSPLNYFGENLQVLRLLYAVLRPVFFRSGCTSTSLH